MKMLMKPLLAALCLLALSTPSAAAPPREKAYATEDLRELNYNDQVRVISLEYEEQSGGRRIPDDQLRFYLDQVNRSDWTFSRIKEDIARSLGGVGPGPGPGTDYVRCESTEGRTRTCPTPWQGRSRISRQLSGTRCDEGRNWSSQYGRVSVWGGCRAEFVAGEDYYPPGPGTGDVVRCESTSNRTRTCPTPWQGPSRISRQLSDTRCDEGRNWSSQYGQVSVWGGCRAEFVADYSAPEPYPGTGDIVRCESTNNRTRTCPTPWYGRSRLIRQLSGAPCVEGRSWNSQDGQVTVWAGCRAEFAPAGGGWGGGNGGYSVTCSSRSGRYTTCAWAPGQGEPRLLQQLSDEACIRGSSWGRVDRNTIWVSRGCRARFGTDRR